MVKPSSSDESSTENSATDTKKNIRYLINTQILDLEPENEEHINNQNIDANITLSSSDNNAEQSKPIHKIFQKRPKRKKTLKTAAKSVLITPTTSPNRAPLNPKQHHLKKFKKRGIELGC